MREYNPRRIDSLPTAQLERPRGDAGPRLARIFPFRHKVEQPRLRLICLPYAGGAAALYRRWSELLAPAIDVCPVELPGRGVRGGEPPARDMVALCDNLAPAIAQLCDGVPIALFGHSMGARIAFEIARRHPAHVVHLFVSGSPAPGARLSHARTSSSIPTAQLTDLQFKQRLRELGGTPPEILADDDLMAVILPVVRADFVLIEQYRAEPQARVACPITVFAGIDDPGASPSSAAAWELRTTAACRVIELEAGHFFLDSHRTSLMREICDVASRLT
jgi:medium-chain acyl-[acyl-carrier-protein] hydrolase